MRRIPFEIWFAALVLAVHLYVAILPANSLMNWFHSDDAFYYFKVAQNIGEGHGITFDRLGNNSGFHPLWMMLLTPLFTLARYDLILPLRLVALLSVWLSAGSAILLYRLARPMLHPYAAAFIAFFWVFNPLVHRNITELGMESALNAFLIALLLYRLMREHKSSTPSYRRWVLTGLVGALAVMARLDNIFLVFVAGVWITFSSNRIRYLLILDLMLIAFGVFAMYFLRVGIGPPANPYMLSAKVMVGVALAVRVPVYYFFGLYAAPHGQDGWSRQLIKAGLAAVASTAIIGAMMLALQAMQVFPGLPRIVIAYEGVYALAAVLLTRWIAAMRSSLADKPLHWPTTILRAACYFAPVGIILLAYMGSSYLYFGTFMPVSGQIKRWWGTIYTIYGHPVQSLFEMAGFFDLGPWDMLKRMVRYPIELSTSLRLALWGGAAALLFL
ncbi:MAG: hypothetical protein ROW52_10075, partial [Anaerolineaceae bacterium]